MQFAVHGEEFVVDGEGRGVRVEALITQRCHPRLGFLEARVPARTGSRRDRCGDCGAKRRGLRRAGEEHGSPQHVGVDLHEEVVLRGDPPAADDPVDGNAAIGEPLDDHAGPEGGRLDERTVHLCAAGPKRLPQEEPRQAGVDQHRAVPVVPVQGEEPGLAGAEACRLVGELAVQGVVALAHGVDPPVEQIPDGGLAGLDAVVPGHHRAIHDPADARHVAERLGRGSDGDVAR